MRNTRALFFTRTIFSARSPPPASDRPTASASRANPRGIGAETRAIASELADLAIARRAGDDGRGVDRVTTPPRARRGDGNIPSNLC